MKYRRRARSSGFRRRGRASSARRRRRGRAGSVGPIRVGYRM